MYWTDEGYLLSKSNFDENSIIIDTFTLNHGKYNGIVYGGASRKQKRNFQIGNKIYLNWKSKGENKSGYFNIELIKPVAPIYFDDKKRTTSILAASSILRILLPERQINQNIYNLFEKLLNDLNQDNWIQLYILWELSVIKELGFESSKTIFTKSRDFLNNNEIKKALALNKNLLLENFIIPNKLKFPLFRNLLESYYV